MVYSALKKIQMMVPTANYYYKKMSPLHFCTLEAMLTRTFPGLWINKCTKGFMWNMHPKVHSTNWIYAAPGLSFIRIIQHRITNDAGVPNKFLQEVWLLIL